MQDNKPQPKDVPATGNTAPEKPEAAQIGKAKVERPDKVSDRSLPDDRDE